MIALLIVFFLFLFPQLAKEAKSPISFIMFVLLPFLLVASIFVN